MRVKEKTGAVVGGDVTPIRSNEVLLPSFYQRHMQKASEKELKEDLTVFEKWLNEDRRDSGSVGRALLALVIKEIKKELQRRK